MNLFPTNVTVISAKLLWEFRTVYNAVLNKDKGGNYVLLAITAVKIITI